MLTTRVIPDRAARPFVGGIDVVPQTNTLDRSLTVWENLYFHGRFFGMSARTARPRPTAARAVPPRRPGRAPVIGALGRHGAAAHGGPGDHAPPADPVPRRADRRPRPAEPHRPVGDPRRAAREGQTILLTTHYMEEADQLCDRLAIIDHGRILALDTPAAQADRRRRHRRDRSPPTATSTAWPLLARRGRRRPTPVVDGTSPRRASGRRGSLPTVSSRPSGTASTSPTSRSPSRRSRPCSSTSPGRTCANDCHHRPNPPRSCTAQPQPRRAAYRRLRRPALRDLVVLRKT